MGTVTIYPELSGQVLRYIGTWNATANIPALINNDTTKAGHVYWVSVLGTQFGIDWYVGDWLVYNELGVIEKRDNNDDVVSVDGDKGAIDLASILHAKTADVPLLTDEFFFYQQSSGVLRKTAYSSLNVYPVIRGINFDGGGNLIPTSTNGTYQAIVAGSIRWAINSVDNIARTCSFDVLKNGVSMVGGGTKPYLNNETNRMGTCADWTNSSVVAGDMITISCFANTDATNISVNIIVSN